jgi:hypothetical protein
MRSKAFRRWCFVDHDLGLDLENRAPHPRDRRGPRTIEVQVRHQPDLEQPPAIAGAELEADVISITHGTNCWTRVPFSVGMFREGLRALEPPVFAETVFTDRDFDTNIISYCNGNDPEIGVRRMYISANIAPIPFSNSSAYRNDEVDELFDQALRTVDLDERSEIYRDIQEILVEELPYFWIVETTATRIFRSECEGFRPYSLFAEEARCEG